MIVERDYISPQPNIWHHIHQILEQHWVTELKDKNISKPPIPLILAGWNFSEDWEKKSRWTETLVWADSNGAMHLIPELIDNDKYYG